MHTFTDTSKRVWEVSVNVGTIKRVHAVLGVDLLDVVAIKDGDNSGGLLKKLIDDPVLLCNILYVLVKEQADKQSVTDEEFGRGMAGDVIAEATTALMRELVNFFHGAKRVLLEGIWKRVEEVQTKATALALKAAESVNVDSLLKNVGS